MITEADKAVAMKIVHKNTGPVFSDQTGLMKISPVKLEYEEGFVPTQPHTDHSLRIPAKALGTSQKLKKRQGDHRCGPFRTN